MKAEYVKTRERGYCWRVVYGNIVTTSCLSAEACMHKHLNKLRVLGYDIAEHVTTPDITEIKHYYYSY